MLKILWFFLLPIYLLTLPIDFVFFEHPSNYEITIKQIQNLCGQSDWLDILKSTPLHHLRGLILEVHEDKLKLTSVNNGIDKFDLLFNEAHFLEEFSKKLQNNYREHNTYQKILKIEEPSYFRQIQLWVTFKIFSLLKKNDPDKSFFHNSLEIAYWEKLQLPQLWFEIQKLEIPLAIAYRYFYGHLITRPLYLTDGTFDSQDNKLNCSIPLGTAIEISQFLKNKNYKRLLEVFTGRGNLTFFLSLIGLSELYTVEKDHTLNLAINWYLTMKDCCQYLPLHFIQKITPPVFIYGDIFDTSLPKVDAYIMDPPYGRSSPNHYDEPQAFINFLKFIPHLQKDHQKAIYTLVPQEWDFMLSKPSIEEAKQILKKSIYFKRKKDRRTYFLNAINEDYIESLHHHIDAIKGSFNSYTIQNVRGKKMSVVEFYQ